LTESQREEVRRVVDNLERVVQKWLNRDHDDSMLDSQDARPGSSINGVDESAKEARKKFQKNKNKNKVSNIFHVKPCVVDKNF